jgi:CheY-like chemotaxis protein
MYKAKILIVDDDESILFAFREVLKQESCIVLEAKNGKDAVEKILSYKPHIIFMDINMPEMNGILVLQRILHTSLSPRFVIMTALDIDSIRPRIQNLGEFEYLRKPLSVHRIRSVLKKYVF